MNTKQKQFKEDPVAGGADLDIWSSRQQCSFVLDTWELEEDTESHQERKSKEKGDQKGETLWQEGEGKWGQGGSSRAPVKANPH